MLVSINLDVLHEKNLVDYYFVDIGEGRKIFNGRPSDEFMQYSGLTRVADDFVEKLNTVNFYFKLQNKHRFFMSCLKFSLMPENYLMLDLKEEDILSFAFRPDTLPKCFSLSNKQGRLQIKENIFKLL